ncbi:MAG: carbohydrate-binding protein [Vicinamibacterales bacterium]
MTARLSLPFAVCLVLTALVAPPPLSAAVGDIVLHTSDVVSIHGNWSRVASSSGAGGEKMYSDDRGWSWTTSALASPHDYFELTFSAPAQTAYRVWIRLRGTGDSKWNESVWVQFSDAIGPNGQTAYPIGSTSGLLANLEDCSGCGVASWGWQDGAYWLARPAPIRFRNAGTHTIRVQTREDGAQIDQIVLSPSAYLTSSPGGLRNDTTVISRNAAPSPTGSSTPFNGFMAPIPGTLQAEGFDSGGEGVAYHDSSPSNDGGVYRNEGVDIAWASSGTGLVGWVSAGEWLHYTVRVQDTGSYRAEFLVASQGSGGSFHLEANGAPVSGSIPIPNTGGWQAWQLVAATVSLTAGQQRLRLVMDTAGQFAVGNFDWFRFTRTASPAPTPTPPPTPSGGTLHVPAGGDLQAAINAANPGDTILLQPGATYTGVFELPAKSGSGYVTIRSAAPDGALPPAGVRITPTYRSQLPRLVSVAGMAVIRTRPGAHHYRLQFLELTSGWEGSDIVQLGDGSAGQSVSTMAHDLIVDRCYIHGDSIRGQKRGIALNSASTTIEDSWISDIKSGESDAQAIAAWNGPGPYIIRNNYLEASGENVMFGGSDPTIAGLVPSDIAFTRNTVTKQTAWRTERWTVKNLLELKNVQRITIDGNVFEHNWAAAQIGYALVLTPRNQDGTAPWSVVRDVQITNNVIRHVAGVFNILRRDYVHISEPLTRVTIRNNLVYDLSGANWGGQGRFLLSTGGDRVTVDHNTIFTDGTSVIYAGDAPQTNFTFTNNILPDNAWAIMGSNSAEGTRTLATYFPDAVVRNNIIAGAPASQYPTGNFYPASMSSVGFIDLSGGNFRLSATSPYRNAATDGADVGVRYDELNAAVGGGF